MKAKEIHKIANEILKSYEDEWKAYVQKDAKDFKELIKVKVKNGYNFNTNL